MNPSSYTSMKEQSQQQDENVFEVDAILEWRVWRGINWYLIKWKDYPEEMSSWEPETHLNCDELLAEFKRILERQKLRGDTSSKVSYSSILEERMVYIEYGDANECVLRPY